MANQTQSSRIQTAKDYEMKTANRFQPLQDFPPLSYSTIVETPISKIQRTQNFPPAPSVNVTPTPQISSNFSQNTETPYFSKSSVEHIILTNFKQIPNYNTLQVFVHQLFPQNSHWLDDPIKTQQFYELILVDSGSVEISHTPDRKIPSQISYSKCTIKKVLPSTDWSNPWSAKKFSINFIPKGYNYQDYRMAWNRALLYRPFDHSWFITFHSNCSDQFPTWFYEWWLRFGPVPDILPPTIHNAFQTWIQKSPGENYKKPLSFHKAFKVPWIFCWSYKILQHHDDEYPLSLIQEFKVKWWAKFTQELCTENCVIHYLQTGKRLSYDIQQISSQKDKAAPKTPTKSAKATKTVITDDSSSDSDGEDPLQQFLQFQQFKKLQKQLKNSKSHSRPPSHGSSPDPMGGPCAQDPFDM